MNTLERLKIKKNEERINKSKFNDRLNKKTSKLISGFNVPGVYLFSSDINGILYIGRSKDLSKRIRSSAFSSISHIKEMVFISACICESESDAAILELYYINTYKPTYNKSEFFDDDVTITIQDAPKFTDRYIYLCDSKDIKEIYDIGDIEYLNGLEYEY